MTRISGRYFRFSLKKSQKNLDKKTKGSEIIAVIELILGFVHSLSLGVHNSNNLALAKYRRFI